MATINQIRENIATVLDVPTSKVWVRLRGLGIGLTCTRCGGTGHFSRNAAGQTYCYKCNGHKVLEPVKKADWEAAEQVALAAVESGAVAKYMAALRGRSMAAKADKMCLDRWKSALGDRYDFHKWARLNHKAKTGNLTPEEQAVLAEQERLVAINSRMADACKTVSNLLFGSGEYKGVSEEDRMVQLPEVLANALREIEDAGKEI